MALKNGLNLWLTFRNYTHLPAVEASAGLSETSGRVCLACQICSLGLRLGHLIIKLPALTGPVEIFLDLIDNVLGNIAELLSPKAGKMARRFRNDMYGQLYAVRRADAARSGKFAVVDDMRDEE